MPDDIIIRNKKRLSSRSQPETGSRKWEGVPPRVDESSTSTVDSREGNSREMIEIMWNYVIKSTPL